LEIPGKQKNPHNSVEVLPGLAEDNKNPQPRLLTRLPILILAEDKKI
jgi:hypothetical protein